MQRSPLRVQRIPAALEGREFYRTRGAPSPLSRRPNNAQKFSEKNVLGSTRAEGHISVTNIWSAQGVQRYRTRGAPFPLHKALRMPNNSSNKKTYLIPLPKARLRQGTFEKPRKSPESRKGWRSLKYMCVCVCQDAFGHNKGQKSAISGRRLH